MYLQWRGWVFIMWGFHEIKTDSTLQLALQSLGGFLTQFLLALIAKICIYIHSGHLIIS